MNYQKKIAYQIFPALFLVLQIFTNGYASDTTFEIDLTTGTKSVRIKGQFSENSRVTNRKNLAFLNSISGANELGNRLAEVRLFDRSGQPVEVKKFVDGEYVAATDYYAWEYTIDLTPSKNTAAAAHISWMGPKEGILMTDDLLPQFVVNGQSASAHLKVRNLPEWKSFSADTAGDQFKIDELTKGVIFVGKSFRESDIKTGQNDLKLLLSGEWLFTDDEASKMAGEIYTEYGRIFGSAPKGSCLIVMMKFPGTLNAGAWEAETRGKTVTLLSSDMPFRTQSLQRLHEQLRHEIFHLWIPNGVKLKGNYAWFYEGFALYLSLKTAVAMNRIRFEDFLDTLSRAYSIDVRQSPRRPLLGADSRAIGVADTQVYARGMLIAFLIDIERMKISKGRIDVTTTLRGLFERYREPKTETDANHAVLSYIGLQQITKRYVEGAELIDWQNWLAGSGIVLETTGRSTVLRVVAKPNGREKEILDRLGYNNWRKGPGTTK